MSDSSNADFRTRLLDEYSQLHDRTVKLRAFIDTAPFMELLPQDRHDLVDQFMHMQSYLLVLTRRVNRLCDNG